jgi:2-dehydro-3-deoxygluconokinase
MTFDAQGAHQIPGGGIVLTIGEIMLSLRGVAGPGPVAVGSPYTASIAGCESNVAIGLARLGHSVRWVGRVGADDAGTLIKSVLRGEGVDIGNVVTDSDSATGVMIRTPRLNDTTLVHYARRESAGARLSQDDLDEVLDPGVSLLHVSGITQALSPSADAAVGALVAAAGRGIVVTYDVNYRKLITTVTAAAEMLRPLLGRLNVLFCGDDELEVLAEATRSKDPISAALTQGIDEVVIKRGPEGAASHTLSEVLNVEALPTKVVDVVGAGDAFATGYLSALLDGGGPEMRLERAVTLAAFCVGTDGDWEGLPHRRDLELLTRTKGAPVR